jgi:hypothetical protein
MTVLIHWGAALATLATALAADYQAGVARFEVAPERWAQAVAIQDAKGGRLVVVTAGEIGFPRAITDLVAGRSEFDRSQVLFVSGPAPPPDRAKLAENLVTLIGAALGDLRPATLYYDEGGGLRVASPDGGTSRAALFGQGPAAGPTGTRKRVDGLMRSAFRMVEPEPVLRPRETPGPRPNPCPVQAIRFGGSLTLVALKGEVAPDFARRIQREFHRAREPLIVVGNSNDIAGPLAGELEPAILDAIRILLRRVGR